jgi:hypothetical protein
VSNQGKTLLVNVASIVLLVGLFSQALFAATVFTREGRSDGELKKQNEKEIVIQPKSGPEIVIPREQILAIYDNEGTLLWSHPSIVQSDPTPEKKTAGEKIELMNTDSPARYRGWHLGATGGFGVVWPSGLFSSFPLGTGPDYRPVIGIEATAARYYQNNQALTLGLGYTRRNIPVTGISESGVTGNGYWPIDYLDLRVGHRTHADIFFLEGGLLVAVKISNAPLNVETASQNLTSSAYDPRSYFAVYAAFGINFPITRQLFGLCMVRVEHGLTAAVTGNAPTATSVAGDVLSTAPISLVPFSATIQLGAAWRL